MENKYHLMISGQGETEKCRDFLSALVQRENVCPQKDLLDQIRMIKKEVRLDIGIKPDCRHCRELAENAMVIADVCLNLGNLECGDG